MERIITYIDGYNLYYSLRDQGWKWAYWLNLHALAQNMLTPKQTLFRVKYFTTRVNKPEDRRRRQLEYLEALGAIPEVEIFYGQFVPDQVICHRCNYTYTTYHEKMTDVNIAVEMMTDALQDKFDSAMLISGDSDLVGLVKRVKQLFKKRVIIAFPPHRKPRSLRNEASAVLDINAALLAKSLFPEKVTKPDGYVLRRPTAWM